MNYRIASNIKLLLNVFVALCLISTGKTSAVTIQKMAKIQAAGNAVFRAAKSLPSSVIKWKTTRYYLDESSVVLTNATDTASATGDTAQFTLAKTTGKYTYYKVFAYEGTQADSLVVQVLIPGVVQKYLFTNLALSSYSIPVWVVLPTKYSSVSKFVTVMCGINRDATNYATYWVPFATANNYIIAAPEFNSTDWSSDGYILGNMFTGSSGSGSLNPKAKWTFNIVQQIHRELYSVCALQDSTYELWGHSAGGQFVHRLAFFLPDNLVCRYIAGNSGWYTCPDLSVVFPWGAQSSSLNYTNSELTAFTNQKLVIMRGTGDTIRDGALNTDPKSDAQGLNRYTRAGYFYNLGKTVNPSLKWKLIEVPGVAHEDQKMSVVGGSYILANPITTSVGENNKMVPDKFSISNYPNPFNPSTKIVFTLKNLSKINLTIYNLFGQRVACLADDLLKAGEHTYDFNAVNLASGIYFCRITGEQINTTLKIQLLK